MGKVQVAKTGYFHWEGEGVTEWTHLLLLAMGNCFRFQNQMNDSTAGRIAGQGPFPNGNYRASIVCAHAAYEVDMNPCVENIMNTFCITACVQNIT